MHDLKQFYWQRADNVIVAEASDLQWNGEQFVYVKSETTGTIAKFKMTEVVTNTENEIILWRFYSSDQCLNMIIFND